MLIGLNGQSRAGKDSVAGILVRKYGFRQVALATAIREILLDLNPLLQDNNGETHTLQGLWHDCYKDWDVIKSEASESVELMIRLGQSARNRISADVWINAAFFPDYNGFEDVVISDIRQPNEVEWVRERYGDIWKIERPNSQKRGMDDLLKGVEFDATILNDGTLEDLEKKVDTIYGSRPRGL